MRTIWKLMVLAAVSRFHGVQAVSSDIVVTRMDSFPSDALALHMPCEESNMLATKCMCHIKCTSSDCSDAVSLCEKYKDSKGCKFVLLRKIGQGLIATLKRVPSAAELRSFDISPYPTTENQLTKSPWKELVFAATQLKRNVSVKLNKLEKIVDLSGDIASKVIDGLNNQTRTRYCGTVKPMINELSLRDKKLAIILLNHKAPRTMLNTLKTWKDSGLLDMVYERIAILNEASVMEIAIAASFGFQVVQPNDIADAKVSAPNLLTIGAAFFYGLKKITSDYVLFMENDFKIDTSLSKQEIATRLLGGIGMLEKGAQVVRLMSRKYQGCGTFKTCEHGAINIRNRFVDERKRNWYSFYCKGYTGTESYVDDCLDVPSYRCFTSWDSNWSLNAVLLKRSHMFDIKYQTPHNGKLSLAEIGLASYKKQDRFETVMIYEYKWQHWKVPICISYDGLFIHEEIETSN